MRGNLDEAWNLTEQNLDTYAFFNMLYKITANPLYQKIRDEALGQLIKYPYEKANSSVMRWEGDSGKAIAIHIWSIPALGPEKLLGLGINPDRMIDFAEQNYAIDARYSKKGGVVFSEDSSRMVLAYKMMSNFYYKKGMVAKARSYKSKANDYLAQLSNMAISGPSLSGQGESNIPSGSLSSTAFALFVYYNYNPLELKE